MRKILLDPSLNFYKGNMHCHSNLSDGKYSPYELKEIYKNAGYSFIAITDHEHFNDNSYLNDDNFLAITAAEYAIKEFPEQSTLVNYNMKVCHLNLYSKKADNVFNVCYSKMADHFSKEEIRKNLIKPEEDYKRVYGTDGINNIIKQANESGFFVCYNHPRWSLENYSDYCGYEGLWGVEIYNTNANLIGLYEYDINVFENFLRDGKKIYASCGDDNHNRIKDSFGAFVMVNAENLTYESIINGLLKGRFYSSTKPLIYELTVENNKVNIKCSDAKIITFSTFGRRSKALIADNGYVNEAEFEFREEDIYFRLDVIDEYNNRANTQAYFINEFK